LKAAILGKGGKDGTGESWQGEIAEFIYYSKSLSDEERESVEDYLSEKYDIPIRKITPATGGEAISADDANTTYTSLSGPFIQEGFFQELTFGGTIVLNAPTGYEWNTSGTYGVTITPAYGGLTTLDASFTSITSTELTYTIDDTSRSTSSPGQLEFTGLQIRPTSGSLPNTGDITNTGTTGQGGDTNYGTLTMIPGTQDSLSFVQQPSATNVDSIISPPVRVQLVDQFGNEVEEAGISVTVALSSGAGILSGVLTETTNAVGIAEFDSLIVDEIGTKELEATSTGLSSDSSSAFEIVNAGTLTGFLVERSPSGTISSKFAGQTFNIALTAIDGTSTTVTTFNGTVVVSSSCTMGSGQGTTSNFTSGVLASLTVSLTSVGVCDITVTNSSGPETGTSNTFTVAPGSADTTNSIITALPTVILNDGSSQSELTVQLVDEFGNNLTSGGNTIVLSATNGTLTRGGSGAFDNSDGTYTDTLTSSTSTITSTITGTLDGSPITDDAVVEFASFTHIWQSQLGSVSDATNWDDPVNWSSGSVPGPGSVILIPANPSVGNEFPVIDQSGITFTSLSMEPSASITISGGINVTIANDLSGGSVLGTTSDSLSVGGDILDVTTINVGTVILNGSSAQTITNPHSYLTLEINNSSGASIEQNLFISDTLKLTSGVLTVPSGISVVAEDIVYGSGEFQFLRSITGNLGWRTISSPVSSDYFDFLDGTLTQGYLGAFYSTASSPGDTLQPNVLTYLESYPGTDNQRYRTPADSSDALIAGQGMFLFVFGDIAADSRYNDPLPDTLAVTGQEFFTATKEVDFGVTYTTTADSGWNLVGNPFGATIDWDDASSWTKTNIESTIYIWDPSANGGNGEYLTWNGSTGTLGNGLISPFQGFWIKANGASPQLKVTTAAKTTGGSFLRKGLDSTFIDPPTFTLELTTQGLEKNTVFMFSDEASQGKDILDAYELTPFSETRLEIYSTLGDGTPLAINNLPGNLRNRYLIPIHINGYENGLPISSTFRIRAVTMDDIPDNWLLLLTDEETGEEINLKEQSNYEFFHSTSGQIKIANPNNQAKLYSNAASGHRFTLKVTTEEIEANIPQQIYLEQNYPNPFNPSTTILYGLDVDGPVLLEVFDILGRKVQTLVSGDQLAGNYSVNFNANAFASGIYIYRLTTDTKVITQKMTLIK
ncbi:MAG: T9SS type A sorting domain-containing protein, partial [Balneolales bacterium]|nr:T9SS type A sorting domain-containing protein [Balneolales bacterium]